MAAQTSADAQAPVSLALMKLGVFFMWEWVQEVKVRIFLYSRPYQRTCLLVSFESSYLGFCVEIR